MKVHVSDALLLPELVRDLLRGGCIPSEVDERTLEVVHPSATDAGEAQTELTFFLRAWETRHPGVELTLG